MEIEDVLAQALIGAFVQQHPDADEERFRRGDVVKYVTAGRPIEWAGQLHDYKSMLADYVRRHSTLDDLACLVELLKMARKCPVSPRSRYQRVH